MPRKPLQTREERLAKKRVTTRLWAARNKEHRLAYYKQYRAEHYEQETARCSQYIASPRGRYSCQKSKAKARNIAWEITFEEWWKIWEPYWDQRGCGKDKLVMARHGDVGPYSPSNVSLITMQENVHAAREKRNQARWPKSRNQEAGHAVGEP